MCSDLPARKEAVISRIDLHDVQLAAISIHVVHPHVVLAISPIGGLKLLAQGTADRLGLEEQLQDTVYAMCSSRGKGGI